MDTKLVLLIGIAIGITIVWIFNSRIFRGIRDLISIPLDILTKKKTKLEIEKLRKEKEARDRRIVLASLDEIEKFDPKYRKIREYIAKQQPPPPKVAPYIIILEFIGTKLHLPKTFIWSLIHIYSDLKRIIKWIIAFIILDFVTPIDLSGLAIDVLKIFQSIILSIHDLL